MSSAGESLLETLAFAEGRLLWIHPFADFNGRTTRVWLREILRRLDLPPVQLAPTEEATRREYLNDVDESLARAVQEHACLRSCKKRPAARKVKKEDAMSYMVPRT